MPYIPESRRGDITFGTDCQNVGELTFLLSEIVDDYVAAAEARDGSLNYQAIADVRAACAGVVREFDRRVADPYEDQKRIDNGDVFIEGRAALERVIPRFTPIP